MIGGTRASLAEFLDPGVTTVEVMLTTKCNLRCAYCYQERKAPRTITSTVLDAAIGRLVSSRLDRPRLTLYGGEPLLAVPLIRRALDRVREWSPRWMNPDVRIITNGTRLDDELTRLLVSRGVFITISFDGIPPAQEDRSPGSFDILDGLLIRLRRDHPTHFRKRLGVKVTLTPRNQCHLSASFRFFLSRGVAEIDVIPVRSAAPAWDASSAQELDDQLREVVRLSIEEFRRSARVPFGPFRRSDQVTGMDREPVCACGSRGLLFVDVDGAIAPCAALAGSTLGKAPGAIRHVLQTLGGLHVTDPDLSAALQLRGRRARQLAFLARPEKRQRPNRACTRCPFRATCVVCPVATAYNAGSIPSYHCQFNRLIGRHRAAFLAAVDDPHLRGRPTMQERQPRLETTVRSTPVTFSEVAKKK